MTSLELFTNKKGLGQKKFVSKFNKKTYYDKKNIVKTIKK